MSDKNQGVAENAGIDLLNITAIRKTVYGFVSRGFSHEIDQVFLDQIRTYLPMLKDLCNTIEDTDFINSVSRLEKFIGDLKDDQKLIEDYARKFVSVFLHIAGDKSMNVDPYESVYLSPERFVMQEPWERVVEFYADFGLGVNDKFKEPVDHIAAELSFISSLNAEAMKDIDAGDNEGVLRKLSGQLEFMNKHLLLWLPALSTDLQRVDPNGLYSIFAELALGFSRADVSFLKDLIEYLSSRPEKI